MRSWIFCLVFIFSLSYLPCSSNAVSSQSIGMMYIDQSMDDETSEITLYHMENPAGLLLEPTLNHLVLGAYSSFHLSDRMNELMLAQPDSRHSGYFFRINQALAFKVSLSGGMKDLLQNDNADYKASGGFTAAYQAMPNLLFGMDFYYTFLELNMDSEVLLHNIFWRLGVSISPSALQNTNTKTTLGFYIGSDNQVSDFNGHYKTSSESTFTNWVYFPPYEYYQMETFSDINDITISSFPLALGIQFITNYQNSFSTYFSLKTKYLKYQEFEKHSITRTSTSPPQSESFILEETNTKSQLSNNFKIGLTYQNHLTNTLQFLSSLQYEFYVYSIQGLSNFVHQSEFYSENYYEMVGFLDYSQPFSQDYAGKQNYQALIYTTSLRLNQALNLCLAFQSSNILFTRYSSSLFENFAILSGLELRPWDFFTFRAGAIPYPGSRLITAGISLDFPEVVKLDIFSHYYHHTPGYLTIGLKVDFPL